MPRTLVQLILLGWLAGVLLSSGRAQGVATNVTVRPAVQDAATIRMAQRLRALADRSDPSRNRFLSQERVRGLGRMLNANSTNYAMIAELGPLFASELLQAGKSEAAQRQYRLLEDFFTTVPGYTNAGLATGMRLGQSLAAFRLGEQENCLANHNAESCLFPLEPAAYHRLPRGSLTALTGLTNLLAEAPDDLRARWLANLAYMTLGKWPAEVPRAILIPPSVFASETNFPRFPDIAGMLGLDVNDLGGGSIIEDFDNDGLLDVLVSDWGLRSPLKLFRNDGVGGFVERSSAAGLDGLWGGLNLVTTDYNNDGFVDVFVLRGAWLGAEGKLPNSLLRNNGDGTFSDVTEAAGLLSFHPTQTAAWFDFDGDGWLDVYIGNESQAQIPGDINPCELYRNNRDGTFTECARANGVAVVGWVKAVAAGDFNNDGRPDLYLSLRDGENLLFRNDGPDQPGANPGTAWKFTEVAIPAGVAQPKFSFPAWFFDYDQDGWQDLFVAGYRIDHVGDVVADYLGLPSNGERARLYRNNRNGTFADESKASGLGRVLHAMGSNFGDLNNDGFPDLYLGTGDPDVLTIIPNRLFLNADGKRFLDVTTAARMGHLQKGHGCVFADLDNDGDQDVFMNMGGAYSGDVYRDALFENPGFGNRWLGLKLEGKVSNRAAIGARLRINVKEPSGPRSIYRWINTGGSFGANPLRAEIGLGQATEIVSADVWWPTTGKTQPITGLVPDQFYRVVEGESAATPWPLPRLRWDPKRAPKHQHAERVEP